MCYWGGVYNKPELRREDTFLKAAIILLRTNILQNMFLLPEPSVATIK